MGFKREKLKKERESKLQAAKETDVRSNLKSEDIMYDLSSIQIDLNERGFENDTKSPFLLESKVVKLYDYHDVPYFLRGNQYVTSGYRAFLSVRMCIKR